LQVAVAEGLLCCWPWCAACLATLAEKTTTGALNKLLREQRREPR
jgi:hypothetical protein